MKRIPLIIAILIVAAAGVTAWWLISRKPPQRELVLYGNVDLRQVELAFNNNERIAAVLVQEGDRVKRGQVLARLDASRLEPQVAQAEATAAAQRRGRRKVAQWQPPARDRPGPGECRVGQGGRRSTPAGNTSGARRSRRIRL